jgi:hypothetical protein
VSVLRESTAVDPRLREYAKRMLGPIGWHGVAMMEYKQDHRTGELFLMEVNGRFWGSLQLPIDAGVDFPHLVCQLARGHRPEAAPPYQIGVKSRWLLGDVDHLCLRLFKSDRELCLPPGAPSRLRTFVEFMKFAQPGLHYEVASRDDPRPFLYELRQTGGALSASAVRFARRPRPQRNTEEHRQEHWQEHEQEHEQEHGQQGNTYGRNLRATTHQVDTLAEGSGIRAGLLATARRQHRGRGDRSA